MGIGLLGGKGGEGLVGLDVEAVGHRQRHAGADIDGVGILDHREQLGSEGVERDGLVAVVSDDEPLGHQRQAVVELVVNARANRRRRLASRRRGEIEPQADALGRPHGPQRCVPDPLPGHPLTDRHLLEAGQLEGGRIGLEAGQPLGSEKGLVGLAQEAADGMLLAVDREAAFRPDRPHERPAGHQVIECDCAAALPGADHPPHEAVLEHDAAVGGFRNPSDKRRGIDMPVHGGPVAGRRQRRGRPVQKR